MPVYRFNRIWLVYMDPDHCYLYYEADNEFSDVAPLDVLVPDPAQFVPVREHDVIPEPLMSRLVIPIQRKA